MSVVLPWTHSVFLFQKSTFSLKVYEKDNWKEKKRKENSFLLFAFTFGCRGSQDGRDGKDNGEKKNKQKQINTPHIHLPYEDKY